MPAVRDRINEHAAVLSPARAADKLADARPGCPAVTCPELSPERLNGLDRFGMRLWRSSCADDRRERDFRWPFVPQYRWRTP